MKKRTNKILACDFETTVYDGQTFTEVWASACVELYSEDVKVFHSIKEQFEYFISLKSNIIAYYHNLKFDGAFWISYLLTQLGFTHAADMSEEDVMQFKWQKTQYMKNKTFSYVISSMGQWYRIIIKTHDKIIELRDSLKLLPFSLSAIGKSFKTKHQKLEMEYTGYRYAGCDITDDEQRYISNDVLVLKEALEIMFEEGNNKLTIGSCCLSEYKKLVGHKAYTDYFPNVYEYELDEEKYGYKNAGEWIKQSYHGGWCYLVKGKENKIFHNGITADVNSLYPSVMSSDSLSVYPTGLPTFWKGNYIPDEALALDKFFFVRIKTRFYLKKNMLPFIQVKNTFRYKSTEMLETSDVYNRKTGKYYPVYKDFDGNIREATVTLTLTMMDYALLKKHYELVDFEIIDGCYFNSAIGIFDDYIDKYKKIKLEATGARRTLAKLFLNNLYGKMASNTSSSFKVAYLKDDKSIGFYTVIENDKLPGYIPVGSAITSYARNFTIKAAQANYYGPDKPGFIYADTDSIHCDLQPEQLKGIEVDSKEFCKWKLESSWDLGWYVRQKTYIEHITAENLTPVDTPFYDVKCAGMPQKCKELFIASMTQKLPEDLTKYKPEEIAFMRTKRELTDFRVGLLVPGKLLPKRIPGGVLLTETTYELR